MHAARALGLVVLAASSAHAGSITLTGRVEATRSRDTGGAIVTESDVRRDDGTRATVIQLGGAAGGIGEHYSHLPPPLAVGDRVALEVARAFTATGVEALVIAGGSPHAAVTDIVHADGARYGVVHTNGSKRPVWRATGCLDIAYGSSVTDAHARVLDAAFATWTKAASCGELAFVRAPERPEQAAADGISSVHVLSSRWCRPATETEPQLCYAPDATGVTRLRFVDDAFAEDDGRIIEADIELDEVDFTLQPVDAPAPAIAKPVIDLPSLATHEIGHLLGLAHSCGTGSEPWPRDHQGAQVPACDGLAPDANAAVSTMYYRLGPDEVGQRTLEDGDVLAVCSLSRALTCEREVVGGCSTARHDGAPAWLLVALVLVWLTGRVPRPASRA